MCRRRRDNKPKLAELREGATPAEVAFHNGMKAAIDDDWSEAATNFREAIKLHEQGKSTGINQGEATSARVNLGIALEEAGDLEGATNAYKEVLDLDPKKWRSCSELCTYGNRSRQRRRRGQCHGCSGGGQCR